MGRPFFMIPMVFKLIDLKRGEYNKLISMLLKLNADRGRAFYLAFRLLNLVIFFFWGEGENQTRTFNIRRTRHLLFLVYAFS